MIAADDARFVGLAIDLARRGEGCTSPNPMVGALVVRDGEIVGAGWHHRAGEDHAEVIALSDAGDRARGATLYTSLEPCCYHGRTPPCVDRIISTAIGRVVASCQDPNPLVDGRGLKALAEADIEVACGVLEEEGRRLNEAFFHFVRQKRPLVTVKAAASLDGRLSAAEGRSRWITGEAAREAGMRLRASHDAVLVGVGTLLADDPELSVRQPALGKPIVRAVLDSTLRTPAGARLLAAKGAGPAVIYHTSGARAERARELAEAGAETVEAGRGRLVDLEAVLADLARRDVLGVLVEGGGEVIASFANSGLADRYRIFVAPSMIGPGGTPLVAGETADKPESALKVRWEGIRRVGDDLLVEAVPLGVRPGSGKPAGAGPGR